jgi:apolipoprotein N-acyltransferase
LQRFYVGLKLTFHFLSNSMNSLNKNNVIALLVGVSTVFGFAPFGQFWIPVLALAVLFMLWQSAATPRLAAERGFSFGLGVFCAGVSWIYVSLHDFGDMPMVLAAGATFAFAAFLALFTALAGYLQARVPLSSTLRTIWVMPVAWVGIEWLRGMIMTGFPWLTLGYAHSNSPLAGYAPVLGVYGVSLVAAISAALLANLAKSLDTRTRCGIPMMLFALLVLWGAGAALRDVAWTEAAGKPFSVALMQGNIPQDRKFREEARDETMLGYWRAVQASSAQLIVLPESAFPMFRLEIPKRMIGALRDHARENGGDVIIGSFDEDRQGYYNSVFSLGTASEQTYHKQHLVVFGEFIPLRPVFGWLINEVLHIPMGDLMRGRADQPPLSVAGQRVAVSICYEDVFGEEIIRALPAATVLVNVTNDGWFGHSPAAAQHNQMAQFRAMEAGRMMLRATNTGMTSIIGVHGQILQQIPPHQVGTLTGMAQGYQGSTPYIRWGNFAVWALFGMMLGVAGWLVKRSKIKAGDSDVL